MVIGVRGPQPPLMPTVGWHLQEYQMGAHLEVEVDTGDVLQILCPDGSYGGKAVYALCSLYSNYKDLYAQESWQHKWFKRLDELTENDPGLIDRITYSGNWNYGEQEYERFRIREDLFSDLSQEDFIRSITAIGNMWTSIDTVINTVQELLEVLPNISQATDWFSPQDTVEGFNGLLATLLLAKSRHGEAIRFRGS